MNDLDEPYLDEMIDDYILGKLDARRKRIFEELDDNSMTLKSSIVDFEDLKGSKRFKAKPSEGNCLNWIHP